MTTWQRRALIGLAVWAVVAALVASVVVPRAWMDANVPPELRADRWELTAIGSMARSRTESLCGELPRDVWLDRPPGQQLPQLLRGDAELTACFDARVAPAFRSASPEDELRPEEDTDLTL